MRRALEAEPGVDCAELQDVSDNLSELRLQAVMLSDDLDDADVAGLEDLEVQGFEDFPFHVQQLFLCELVVRYYLVIAELVEKDFFVLRGDQEARAKKELELVLGDLVLSGVAVEEVDCEEIGFVRQIEFLVHFYEPVDVGSSVSFREQAFVEIIFWLDSRLLTIVRD